MNAILDHNGLQGLQRNEHEVVMKYGEAATFLGLSERSLQRYVSEGRIPHVRLPKRGAWAGVRFLRSDLVHWLERQTIKPRRSRPNPLTRNE